jgi:hypothetical protein
MTNPVPFSLVVANSNPNSRFSHYEIVCAIEVEHPRTEHVYVETILDPQELEEHPYSHSDPFYVLYGRYADPYYPHPEHGGAREICRFENLKDAKEFLVELNGPIEEDQDDE